MPLSTLGNTSLNRAIGVAKKLLEEIKPILDGLNIVYDTPTTGLKATIVQADLDARTDLSGLTKAQLDDAMFVISTTVKNALATSYTQLAHLAARG